jgi:hypothetical protein
MNLIAVSNPRYFNFMFILLNVLYLWGKCCMMTDLFVFTGTERFPATQTSYKAVDRSRLLFGNGHCKEEI